MTQLMPFGARCLAQDGLGNRCVKQAGHRHSPASTEAEHDATRGTLIRRWH